MKAVLGLILMMALGLCFYALQARQLASLTGAASPATVVDSVAVKTDLMTIANVERQQYALEGRYLTLAELGQRGVKIPDRRGSYVFSAEVTDQTFLISATFEAPPDGPGQPTLTIGPDMQIK
ncbi:MAG: hypothetical protein AB7Q29_07085 [Vicinamibacterales bacterium]